MSSAKTTQQSRSQDSTYLLLIRRKVVTWHGFQPMKTMTKKVNNEKYFLNFYSNFIFEFT